MTDVADQEPTALPRGEGPPPLEDGERGRATGPGGRRALGFRRSHDDRVVAGVLGGLGRAIGIDPVLLRLAVAVLATAGGAGIVAYLLAWGLSAPPDAAAEPSAPRRTTRQIAGVALVVMGLLLLLRDAGLWLGDGVTWPLALVAAGSAALLRGRRDQLAPTTELVRLLRGERGPGGWPTASRAVAGALLVLGGLGVFVAAGPADLTVLGPVLVAMLVTAAGLGLLFGPRIWELSRSVAEERRERIRSAERAEMAAHLHDSVLQTLALIQRAREPAEMTRLARAQERDLRNWLYGSTSRPGQLRAAVEELAARAEARHGVRVDVVCVGEVDIAVDDRLAALVAALGEAVGNAARHSGAASVSLFVEVDEEVVDASVVDAGVGFDPEAVPSGHLGIAESIEGRMRRAGGEAEIDSVHGEGTDVRLRLRRGSR